NGTTNYILTRMTESGASFADALSEAQELGYAEPDPTNDVEAWDAAYKLAILASLAFGAPVMPEQVFREGITQVSQRDILYAAEVQGDLIGTALFYGRGAGSEPTASAVVADLIALGTSAGRGSAQPAHGAPPSLRPMRSLQTRYFLRVLTIDRPGVMAAIAT